MTDESTLIQLFRFEKEVEDIKEEVQKLRSEVKHLKYLVIASLLIQAMMIFNFFGLLNALPHLAAQHIAAAQQQGLIQGVVNNVVSAPVTHHTVTTVTVTVASK